VRESARPNDKDGELSNETKGERESGQIRKDRKTARKEYQPEKKKEQ
jgi:hypothetical protein